jgi:hypothetical protein
MFRDSPGPEFPASGSKTDAGLKPSDEDVVRTLVEIEHASSAPQPSADSPIHVVPERSWLPQASPLQRLRIAMAFAGLMLVGVSYLVTRQSLSRPTGSGSRRYRNGVIVRTVDSSTQAQAEEILTRVAAGDAAASDQVLESSANWIGKTHRTPKSEQLISSALNAPDMHARAAAVQAELALDGIAANESGLGQVESVVGDPGQRVWSLWMLGALGNRGVDPAHTAKIIAAYLTDPQVEVRAGAVDALALVATDETLPLVLDRFRNDPSPLVQDRAACDLAESGMYTRVQRTTAAASLINWLDDSQLSPQQHAWAVQALTDISGRHLGNDSAAWRSWYESTR